MTQTNPVLLDIEKSIALITINRPSANAINKEAVDSLLSILNDIEENKDIRVIMITGQGEKGFCAGFDLKDGANANYINPKAQELCNRLEFYTKPIIAVINGFALGGGCEIALACHFRFMTTNPKACIGLPETDLGVLPVWGGTQRLPKIVGKSKAMELIFMAQRLSPEEAHDIGLVDKLYPADILLSQSRQFAEALASRPPLACSAVLKAMTAGEQFGLNAGLEMELAEVANIGLTDDAMEGMRAFFEKRKPVFKGR